MLNKYYLYIPLALFLALCVFLWRGMSLEPKKIPSNIINQSLPALTLEQINGKKFQTKDLKGQVSVLHVWATWCATCRAEHSFLMDKRKAANFIALVYQDNTEHVRHWLSDFGDPYQRILFTNDEATLALGIYGTPETFIIDKAGVIRFKHVGEINQRNWPKILAVIKQLKGKS